MTNEKIIAAVNAWQKDDTFHPLTCIISRHRNLVPVEEDGKVLLICPDCDYVQNWVPDCVLSYYFIELPYKKETEIVMPIVEIVKNPLYLNNYALGNLFVVAEELIKYRNTKPPFNRYCIYMLCERANDAKQAKCVVIAAIGVDGEEAIGKIIGLNNVEIYEVKITRSMQVEILAY